MVDEIKDLGIILSRKLIREDDIMMYVLSRRHGQLLLYAHKAAISKRRFSNSCEILRHVQFYAKKSHHDFWTLEEISTFNYFKELPERYRCYIVANRALALIKKITPIEHPAERLYLLLGGFLQFLTGTETPELAWPIFEIKVIQEAGIFSMNLIRKAVPEQGLVVSPDEIALIQTCLDSRSQQWLFSRSPPEVAAVQKLEPLLRRIREDYGLSV